MQDILHAAYAILQKEIRALGAVSTFIYLAHCT